nr:glycoside hydrolase family 15 protein [Arthrobacter sp. Bi26]
MDKQLWAALTPIVEMAIRRWRVPDSGPWEIRTPGRAYSAALCFVAIDRAIRIDRRDGLPYPKRRWETTAREIRKAALTQSWDDERRTLTEHLGGSSRADPLGLLPEQIHPDTGEILGNFPQAFSHVGVLASGLRAAAAEGPAEGHKKPAPLLGVDQISGS